MFRRYYLAIFSELTPEFFQTYCSATAVLLTTDNTNTATCMFIVACFTAVYFEEMWVQLPEYGKIIVPKHVAAT